MNLLWYFNWFWLPVSGHLTHELKSMFAVCTVCTQRKNRVFSPTWPASMQISWNKRKRLHKKRVQLPEDWFGTPTWPPFHCFGTPIWPLWRHVKTLYKRNHFSDNIYPPSGCGVGRQFTRLSDCYENFSCFLSCSLWTGSLFGERVKKSQGERRERLFPSLSSRFFHPIPKQRACSQDICLAP